MAETPNANPTPAPEAAAVAIPRLKVRGMAHVPDGYVDQLTDADLKALKANHPDMHAELMHAIKVHADAHDPSKKAPAPKPVAPVADEVPYASADALAEYKNKVGGKK